MVIIWKNSVLQMKTCTIQRCYFNPCICCSLRVNKWEALLLECYSCVCVCVCQLESNKETFNRLLTTWEGPRPTGCCASKIHPASTLYTLNFYYFFCSDIEKKMVMSVNPTYKQVEKFTQTHSFRLMETHKGRHSRKHKQRRMYRQTNQPKVTGIPLQKNITYHCQESNVAC